MAIRLPVKIKFFKKEIETVALANTGYETEEPQILLPSEVAKKLEIWPELPQGTTVETYTTSIGEGGMYSIKKKFKVWLPSNPARQIHSMAIIAEKEQEVLLSDALISALGIIIEDAKKGLWRVKKRRGGKKWRG